MRTYSQIQAFSRTALDAAGLNHVSIHPGPDLPDIPDEFVVWTRYGGPGLELDGAMDARSWQLRAVGKQMDYDSAEEIADALDVALLSHHSSEVGGLWVSDIRRVGGAPNALMVDSAERTHFVCSYIVSVELALTN